MTYSIAHRRRREAPMVGGAGSAPECFRLQANAGQTDSGALLLFEGAHKVVQGQCADNLQIIIEHFE